MDVPQDDTFSELLNTMSVEYFENLEGISMDMSMPMLADVGTDVDNESLETLLFEHGEAKCLFLRKILKSINKYHHHDKFGILEKKLEYLIEYMTSGDWEWWSSTSTSGKSGKSGSKHGGSGAYDYLKKKLEYLIEYKCNKETSTTVGHFHIISCSVTYVI